jgi:putative ABC transport system ATP-binding protein
MIKLSDVHKTFHAGTPQEVRALRSVNLEIGAGDFVTVIGTNGSGKSTLLNAIAGSFLPDRGRVEISGVDVSGLKEHQRARFVSRVFQNPYLGTAPQMTIAENLHLASLRGSRRFPLIRLTPRRKEIYREQVSALEMQLEERLEQSIGTLSGGQRQALTLLMAVLVKPQVLLLDEHTAALDPKSAAQVIKLTRKFIAEEKLTAVMITHSMQQALELGNRTIMMHKGAIIDDISLEEKQGLSVNDFLEKFAELRKLEQLTAELLESLRREYV